MKNILKVPEYASGYKKKITLTKRRLGGTEVKLMVQKTQ